MAGRRSPWGRPVRHVGVPSAGEGQLVSSARQAAAKKPAASRKSATASRAAAEPQPATKPAPRKRAVTVVEDPETPVVGKRTTKAATAKVAAAPPPEAAAAEPADPEALEPD